MAEVKKAAAKTAVKAEPVKEAAAEAKKEVKAAPEVKAEVKKAPAKKAAVKKPADKKAPAKKAAVKKETASKETAKQEGVKETVNFQFSGKSYTPDALLSICRDVWKYDLNGKEEDFKSVELYVKPEENTTYYVINGDVTGSFFI